MQKAIEVLQTEFKKKRATQNERRLLLYAQDEDSDKASIEEDIDILEEYLSDIDEAIGVLTSLKIQRQG